MNTLLLVLIAVGVAAVSLAVARPQAAFVVRVRNGRPESSHGKVTEAFLETIGEVFRDFGLEAGEIRGIPRGRRIALWFSPGMPPGACQRLRNWWAISGWSASPQRKR